MEDLVIWLHTPPKGDRDLSRSHVVFTTCNSSIPDHLQGTSTPSSGDQLWQVLDLGRGLPGHHGFQAKTSQNLTVSTIWTFDQLWQILCLSGSTRNPKVETEKLTQSKNLTESDIANPHWTMHHVRPPWRSSKQIIIPKNSLPHNQ